MTSPWPLGLIAYSPCWRFALLSQEGVAQIGSRLNLIGESFDHFRQACHGLDARVPGLLGDLVGERYDSSCAHSNCCRFRASPT